MASDNAFSLSRIYADWAVRMPANGSFKQIRKIVEAGAKRVNGLVGIGPARFWALHNATFGCKSGMMKKARGMQNRILPDDLDAQSRERLGRLTLALAEDIERLHDPCVTAVMKALMKEVGRVIARDFDDDLGDSWKQQNRGRP